MYAAKLNGNFFYIYYDKQNNSIGVYYRIYIFYYFYVFIFHFKNITYKTEIPEINSAR